MAFSLFSLLSFFHAIFSPVTIYRSLFHSKSSISILNISLYLSLCFLKSLGSQWCQATLFICSRFQLSPLFSRFHFHSLCLFLFLSVSLCCREMLLNDLVFTSLVSFSLLKPTGAITPLLTPPFFCFYINCLNQFSRQTHPDSHNHSAVMTTRCCGA